MFTIYIDSFDIFVATLDLIEFREMCCRVALVAHGCDVVRGVDVPLRDLEFLLNNKYGEENDNTKITVKVDGYDVTIEKYDVVEYEEPCPHCGATVFGVTDSSLIATCSECGKEIMICSFCPTHCSVKEDCDSCLFSGMNCIFACNGNTGDGCHMKLRAKNIKPF